MKVCPVCSESFPDDLKFCDLDGTRLTRQLDGVIPAEGGNKLWSMLGIGLLVGALVLSAVSVFLIPKARVSTPVSSSESQASTSANKPSSGAADSATASATTEQPEIVVTEGPLPDAKKKEKLKALTDENSNAPALNPKAAAQGINETEKTSQPVAQPPAPAKPEPAPAIRTVSETREPDPATKPAASPDPKKDPKHATTNSSKESDKKKTDDKDKKKGGFFKVFKKIFGKD
jgi:hypothetical protein